MDNLDKENYFSIYMKKKKLIIKKRKLLQESQIKHLKLQIFQIYIFHKVNH
jgi:hypothetical protein